MEKGGRLGMTRNRHVTTMFNSLTSHTRPLPGRYRNVFSKKAEIEAIIRRYQPEIDDHSVHTILSIFAEMENNGDETYLRQEIASIMQSYDGSFATNLQIARRNVVNMAQEIRDITEHKEELDSKPLERPKPRDIASPHVDGGDAQIRYDKWFPPLNNSTSTGIVEAHQSRAACWGNSPRLKQILLSRSASLKRNHNGVQKRLSHSTSPHYLKKAHDKSDIGKVAPSKASESCKGFICRGPDPNLKAEIRHSAISAFKQLRHKERMFADDFSDAVRPAKLARGIGTSSDVADQLLNMQLGSSLDEAAASRANWSFVATGREQYFIPIRAAPDTPEEIVTEAPPEAVSSPFVSEPLECWTIGYLSYFQVSGKVQECSVLTPTLDHVFPDGCVRDSCMLDPNNIEESVSIEEFVRGGEFDGTWLCTNNVIKFVYKSKRNTKRIQTNEDPVFEGEEVDVEESEESETEEREEGAQFYLGSELLESLEQGEFVRDEVGGSFVIDDETDKEEWPAPPPPEALPQLASLNIWARKVEPSSSTYVFGDVLMETAGTTSPHDTSSTNIACLWPGTSAQSLDSGVASWRKDDLSKVWQHSEPQESENENKCLLCKALSGNGYGHGETQWRWCNNVEEALARTMKKKVCTPDKLKREKQLLGPSLFDAVFSSDSECDRVMPGLGSASCGEGSFDATRKPCRNVWAMAEDSCEGPGAVGEPVGVGTNSGASGGIEAGGFLNNSVLQRPMPLRPLKNCGELEWLMAGGTGEQGDVGTPGDTAKLDFELDMDMDSVLSGMFWLQAGSYSAPRGSLSSSEDASDTENWKRRNGILGLEDYSDEDTGPFVSRRLENPRSPVLAGSGDKRTWSYSEGQCVSSPNKRLKSYRDPLTQEEMEDKFHSFFKRQSEAAASSLPELPIGGTRSQDLEERWRHEADGSYRVQQPMLGATKAPGVQPKVCSLYLEGLCERLVCRYSHDPALITCRHWEQNKCYKGSACPFLHGYRPRGCFEGLSCEQLGYSWKDSSPGKSGGEGAVSRASPSTRPVRRRLNFGTRSRNPSGSESKPHEEKRRTRRKSGSTSSTSGTHRTRSRGGKASSPVDIVSTHPPWRRRTRSDAPPDDEWGL